MNYMNYMIRTEISIQEIKDVSKRFRNEIVMRGLYAEMTSLHRCLDSFRFRIILNHVETILIGKKLDKFHQYSMPSFLRLLTYEKDIVKTERMMKLMLRLKSLVHSINMLITLLQAKPRHVKFQTSDDWNVSYNYWKFKTFDWN